MDYSKYLYDDLKSLQYDPPASSTGASFDFETSAETPQFLAKIVKIVTNELLRHEHKNLLHDQVFIPAMHHFVMLLRPWLLALCSIFLLILIVGVLQLTLLLAQKKLSATTTTHAQNDRNFDEVTV